MSRLSVIGERWWMRRVKVREWLASWCWRDFAVGRRDLVGQLTAQRAAKVALVEELLARSRQEKKLVAHVVDLETRLEIQRGLTASAQELPGLSPAEIERLAMLGEECGEVMQIVGKILRHGWDSCSPFDPKCRPNRVLLERELGDVRALIDVMMESGDARRVDVASWRDLKRREMPKWTHHQGAETKGEAR